VTADRARMVLYMAIVGMAGIYVLVTGPDYRGRVLGAVLLALAANRIIGSLRAPSELDEVMQRAAELKRTNPAAADELLDKYFQKAGERQQHERDALRQLARTDLDAAKRLKKLLRNDLKGDQAMRKGFLPTLASAEKAVAETMIAQREHKTRAELEQLNETIHVLKTGHGAA